MWYRYLRFKIGIIINTCTDVTDIIGNGIIIHIIMCGVNLGDQHSGLFSCDSRDILLYLPLGARFKLIWELEIGSFKR